MSMPIQRQSEQFSAFDTGTRWARDRSSTELPKGLAGLINSTGPRIQAGLLNTREAAGYDFGKGPRDHGGHGPDGGPSVPDWYYDDDDDDDGDPEDPPGTPTENPWDRRASRHPFDLAADGRLAQMSYEDTMAHIDDVLAGGEGHKMHDVPGVDRSLMRDHISEGFDADGYCPDCERTFVEGHEPGFLCNEQNEDTPRNWNASRRTAAGVAVDPAAQQQMMVPDGGGYQPGHRVGLPWRDTVIPGTVIGVDGPQVVIRWDEGQYSNEEPRNIQLL